MSSVPNTTSEVSPVPTAFSVAIVGGGIGGLVLALGLLKYPHIDVHVYESAPSFGEIGAGVALGPNAQRALEMIGPAAKAAFDKHVTPNMWSSKANNFAQYLVGKGEHAGEPIIELKNATGMQSVHRAHFLDELVKAVPAQRAHFSKRLVSIEDKAGSPVLLSFKDGTNATADVVIGADGIHSSVRTYLLGPEAAAPVFSGSVAYRGITSMDAAVEKLGAEYAQNSMMVCGPGRAILSYPIDHGALLNIAAMDFEQPTWDHEKTIVPLKWDDLSARFEGWIPQTRALVDLLNAPNLATWSVWDTSAAPTYVRNRVAILGDAAHATTPYQGQGAGQAIEDALVLSSLLARIPASDSPATNATTNQIPKALLAYNQVRRPRAQSVVETSREVGKLIGMQMEGVGGDVGKMREALETKMHWIWQRDMVDQVREAGVLFGESL